MKRAFCLAALVLVPVALAGSAVDPGITATSILLGTVAPLTSPDAAVSRGADAYLRYVDSRGGVDGRLIRETFLDDGGDRGRAAADTVQLAAQNRVFAIFDPLGAVAAPAAVSGPPVVSGYVPSGRTQGYVLGRQIAKTQPRARIAVLYEDDAAGTGPLAGLRAGLGSGAGRIVLTAGYDPAGTGVAAQVAGLRATDAQAFAVFASGGFVTQALVDAAQLGWRPRVYLASSPASAADLAAADRRGAQAVTKNAIATTALKDPNDPLWANDPGIELMQRVLSRYAGATDVRNPAYVAGLAAAFTLVDTLKRAGRAATRAGVATAFGSLVEADNPLVVPGIVVAPGAGGSFPRQQVALERWSGGHWNVFTGPLAIAG